MFRGQCETIYSVHCPPGQRLFRTLEDEEAFCDCDVFEVSDESGEDTISDDCGDNVRAGTGELRGSVSRTWPRPGISVMKKTRS